MNEKGFEGGVLLCCIGKNENDYIREFVEHYLALGFSHIRIYDNNDPDGEDFRDVIGDYVESGFVDIVDYRGRARAQLPAYNDCARRLSPRYGWTAFFDCDEFLDLRGKYGSVQEWLGSIPNLENYDVIHVNWRCYDDNGLLRNDGRPLWERFSTPRKPLDWQVRPEGGFPENNHVKSIVRTTKTPSLWTENAHTPTSEFLKDRVCDWAGRPVENSPFRPYDFEAEDAVVLRHYCTKTISEYLEHKFRRGLPDRGPKMSAMVLTVDYFFARNDRTPEKERVAEEFLAAHPLKKPGLLKRLWQWFAYRVLCRYVN